MIRASVLVSGGGANLQALLDAYAFREIENLELGAVISSVPGVYALERAKNAHIPAYVVERALFPNNASFSNALLGKLRDLDTDLVISAGFSERIGYTVLRFYRGRVIAVQPTLFPAFCTEAGFDPLRAPEQILRAGVRITGATAYFMTEEDNGVGPIIDQEAVRVLPGDTASALQERVMREGEWKVLPRAVALYCAGKLRPEKSRVAILP